MSATPLITVVVCTHNRAELVERTLRAVLDQHGVPFEVVVVDDGSTDATPKVLAAIDDGRLRVVRQDNSGLSVARNAGAAVAVGSWLVFLDDDDVPQPGWLAALAGPMDDPGVGITCCGSTAVDPDGNEIAPMPPVPLPEPFGGVVASYRAGTFAVRSELYHRAGGYLDGLGTSHQFELFIRLKAETDRQRMRIESTDVCALHIERRPVDERRGSNPHIMYDSTSWILARHPVTFAAAPARVAAFEGVRGTTAARSGAWSRARRHFWTSARLEPRRLRSWGRFALSLVPPLGRRFWHRTGAVTYRPAVGILVQRHDRLPAPERETFLAWGYEENPPAASGPEQVTGWAQRLAERQSRRHRDLVVRLSDELERDDDPVGLLQHTAQGAGGAPVLMTMIDREASDPDRPIGPPSNPDHRRQWSSDQARLLLRSTGFDIERSWRRGDRLVLLVRAAAGTK